MGKLLITVKRNREAGFRVMRFEAATSRINQTSKNLDISEQPMRLNFSLITKKRSKKKKILLLFCLIHQRLDDILKQIINLSFSQWKIKLENCTHGGYDLHV